jgi:tripartite-type tricarboxylate transporter receptor subunit TctC
MKSHSARIFTAFAFAFAFALAFSVFGQIASAQSLSSKPITIVVAYPAGGDTDLMARVFAEKLSAKIGNTVIVDNKSGATGIVGSTFVSKAAPDGHTLLLSPGSLPYVPLVLKGSAATSYDPLNGFTPILHVGDSPQFLVANPNAGFKNFADVVNASKTRHIAFGTAGIGGIHHIISQVVNKAANIQLDHIPYKGVAPEVADVVGGQIPLAYLSLGTIKPYLETGKLIALAELDRERTPLMPNVPTLWEQGYKVNMNTWYGLYGPKGMDPKLAELLNGYFNEIIKMPDVVSRMKGVGTIPGGGSPADMEKLHAATYQEFSKIIQEFHIVAE